MGAKNLATCLGYRNGTGCTNRSRSTQNQLNWEKWQLCYSCARKLHPEYYANKPNHGVGISEDRKILDTIRSKKTMKVIGCNITSDAVNYLEEILCTSPDFIKFQMNSRLDLHDKTVLIRLAIINLFDNIPSFEKMKEYGPSLLRPSEFEFYLKSKLQK